ncbi:ATP-binding cassette domain-containing protein [Aquisalimonas lutea]|uniref:ATP-binding cassette domain-containing protein n=1 Tax=Aquisalimonas lutea TaxID=1327750 RepID=UPI0025B48A04|nr:ATP-binding cassette domain-containing protein [Aquisalimonas lutea]MDN3518682.1 ATP-binding cassette domain-containing protein [Aquisalimonas lutea]
MLLQLQDITLAFSGPPVLDHVYLEVQPGERICLLGRNGTGKSTLMKVIEGSQEPDSGRVIRPDGVHVARMEQDVPGLGDRSVRDVVAEGLGQPGADLQRWEELSARMAAGDDDAGDELQAVQQRIETAGGWQLAARIDAVLSRLELSGDLPFDQLSGGRRRRVLLARALVNEPDLLLLDEPTNHLDIDSVDRLERMLLGFRGTVLFITHDRAFLRRLATRILELDRGQLTSWPGDYDTYLGRREAALEAEQQQQERFDRKLAKEEAWIRQGIKARRKRNQGRVRALKAMREERRERRERAGNPRLEAQAAERSGKLVIEADRISGGYPGETLFRDFSTTIQRGDKVGFIGPNGCGKTTLLRILLGHLEPSAGRIRHGTNLQVAWFDQLRETLDPNATVRDTVGGGRETVNINGEERHVVGYLQDFLFEPSRTRSPVSSLSGGERSRLMLARLFTRPANVLVLDEPTNDLDLETLDLLEQQLVNFDGTLLLVSHDREFLDNTVTGTIAFDPDGELRDYVGGYNDWLRQRPAPPQPGSAPAKPAASPAPSREPAAETAPARKLSYKEKRELEQLPGRIEALEAEQAELSERMADPAFHRQEADAVARATQRLQEVEQELEQAYQRWAELEGE